jgi:hypothetical protein
MESRADRRLVLTLVIALAVLAVLGPFVFSLAGNLVGIVYIVAAIALLALIATRWERDGGVEVAESRDRVHRVLVLAHAEADAGALAGALPADAAVHVVVPALTTRTNRLTGEIDEAVDQAEEGVERLVAGAQARGRSVDGTVGDTDPRTAVEDSLRTFAADEVLVLPPPQRDLEFFHVAGPEEAFRDVRLPVTVVGP